MCCVCGIHTRTHAHTHKHRHMHTHTHKDTNTHTHTWMYPPPDTHLLDAFTCLYIVSMQDTESGDAENGGVVRTLVGGNGGPVDGREGSRDEDLCQVESYSPNPNWRNAVRLVLLMDSCLCMRVCMCVCVWFVCCERERGE